MARRRSTRCGVADPTGCWRIRSTEDARAMPAAAVQCAR
jgi:hypothetical protein